jgi:VWFA-related protein
MTRRREGRWNIACRPCRIAAVSALAAAACIPVAPARSVHAQQQTQPGSTPYRIETGTRIVLVPALVRDRAGRHVPGLKAEDFKITDDGQLRPVKTVEEIATPPATELERTKLPAGTYSNDVRHTKAPLRVVIILFDMLNSHFKDQVPGRKQLAVYLRTKVQPGTMVALLGLGRGGLRMYHDLTSDTQGLATEIEQAMESGRHSISQNLQGELSDTEAEEAFVGHGGFEQTHSSGRSSKKLIVEDTLAAFRNIAGAYSSLPGRKSLVWMTTGFPFSLDDSKGGHTKKGAGLPTDDGDSLTDIMPDYEATWQALSDANVALYPVDMHGLEVLTQPDATTRTRLGGGNGESIRESGRARKERADDSFDSMDVFAEQTGGVAFMNDNDLTEGLRQAVADSSSSYLLALNVPLDAAPGWHKLRVTVNRPGVKVRARSGYLVPKRGEERKLAGAQDQGAEGADRPEVALAMNSPMNYTAVPLTVRWLPLKALANQPGVPGANMQLVPFQIVLPAHSATLSPQGDAVSLEFIAVARDSKGEDAANFVKKLNGQMKPETARRLEMAGVKYDSALKLAPGYYNVRFVVRDNFSGKVGSVTAPVNVPDPGPMPAAQ